MDRNPGAAAQRRAQHRQRPAIDADMSAVHFAAGPAAVVDAVFVVVVERRRRLSAQRDLEVYHAMHALCDGLCILSWRVRAVILEASRSPMALDSRVHLSSFLLSLVFSFLFQC